MDSRKETGDSREQIVLSVTPRVRDAHVGAEVRIVLAALLATLKIPKIAQRNIPGDNDFHEEDNCGHDSDDDDADDKTNDGINEDDGDDDDDDDIDNDASLLHDPP
jgi:hypothetical protein